MPECQPEFLQVYFNTCLHCSTEYLAFITGLASIGIWMFAQMPQMYTNFKLGHTEGLSPLFLASWLMGDLCNLLGCILSGTQIRTQLYTAVYFVAADCMLIAQYVFYSWPAGRRGGQHRANVGGVSEAPSGDHRAVAGSSGRTRLAAASLCSMPLRAAAAEASRPAAQRAPGSLVTPYLQLPRNVAGLMLGWISALFYLSSRLSQIHKNHQRKTTSGLSDYMFYSAIAANTLYGVSILLPEGSVTAKTLPWLIGSLGTVALDAIIIAQALHYRRGKHRYYALLPEQNPASS